MPHALLVAQDLGNLNALRDIFDNQGYSLAIASTLGQAQTEIAKQLPDVALIRPALPDGDGLSLLQDSRFAHAAEVLLLAESDAANCIVSGLRVGSGQRETRGFGEEELVDLLRDVAQGLADGVVLSNPGDAQDFADFRGESQAMHKLWRLLRQVAPTQATVFLIGESGTGKELLAQALHHLSERRQEAFVAVNCGAIAEELMESELFGHEKGSFTSASRQHRGIFERADQGTLFLDEITEMPLELQVKLLRALETGRFSRVGGEQEIQVNVRVIAATNRDPAAMVKQGRLREDLYYRLAQFPLQVPPLRDRNGDIEILAEYFLQRACQGQAGEKHFSSAALAKLRSYSWPGNVRELKHVIERACIVADAVIDADDLLFLGERLNAVPETGDQGAGRSSGDYLQVRVGDSIEMAEKALILATLEKNQGEKQKTADELGISIKTLYNRLSQYDSEEQTSLN